MAQSGPTMVPYMLTAEPSVHDFTFKEQHVVHCVPTAKTLASQYIQGTTGIVPAGNIQI
jgi:peptidase E